MIDSVMRGAAAEVERRLRHGIMTMDEADMELHESEIFSDKERRVILGLASSRITMTPGKVKVIFVCKKCAHETMLASVICPECGYIMTGIEIPVEEE